MYLTQGLHRALQQKPDAVAVWFQDRQYTFRQFAERVASLAGALRALGLHTEDRVAILALADIKQHCRKLIAGYKIPRSIEFRESLPLSGAGKVLKTELRKPYWENNERAVN